MQKIQITCFLLLATSLLFAQQQKISGTIRSAADQLPLIGATVLVKNTERGVVSDINGSYSISAAPADTLEFSYLGFASQYILVGNQTIINISLSEGEALREVVVTALSIEREKDRVGYAVSEVDALELVQAQELNIANALSGKVAGLQISAAPTPGSSSKINLRGIRFVNQDNAPLIVVDGIPINSTVAAFEEQEFFGLGGQDFGNGLEDLNPDDIANVSVLKGITAASLYGSRGSNGVIIITTKKGRAAKAGLGVSVNTSFLVDQPYRYREVQNEYGQGEAGAWLGLNDNGDGTFNRQYVNFWQSGNSWGPRMEGQSVLWDDGQIKPYEAQPNNLKDPLQNGTQQNTSVSFSSGSEKVRFRGGFSYANTNRIIPNSFLRRFSVNTKTNTYLADNLSVEFTATYSKNENQNPPVLGNSESSLGKNWLYNWNRSMRPDVLSNFRQGEAGEEFVDIGFRGWRYYKEVQENKINDKSDRLIGGFTVNYEITDWLKFTARTGMDMDARHREFRVTKDQPGSFTGRYDTGQGIFRQSTYEGLLTFNKKLHSDFTLTVTAGASDWSQRDEFLSYSTQSNGLTKESIFHVSAVNVDVINDFDGLGLSQQIYRKTIRSVFGLTDLAYKNFLNVQITGRMDWSSTLPLDRNNYFYPSVNSSLVLHEAFRLPDLIDKAILRASWAQVRTDESPYVIAPTYAEATRLGQYSALLGDPNTIPPTEDLQPSQLSEYEIGTEVFILDSKLGLELTMYQSNATKQSITAPLPLSSGFSAIRLNSAEIRNRGIEISLLFNPINKQNFSWDARLNLSHNRNKVLRISDETDRVSLGRFAPGTDYVWSEIQAVVGEAYGLILNNDYAYTPDGKRIINPDGSWQQTDEIVPVGNVQADLIAGLNNTLRYKNIRLSFLLDGTFGYDAYWGTKDWAERLGQSPVTLANRDAASGGLNWTDDAGNVRDDGVVLTGMKEVFDAEGNVTGYTENDIIVPSYVEWQSQPHAANVLDGSFLKLRELSLTYSIPAKKLQNAPIQGLRIGLVGKNLMYLYSALPDRYNPEAVVSKRDAKQGIEFGALPSVRSFGVNLQVKF